MNKTEAIEKAGSAYRLAKMLGVTRQAVSKWPGDHLPPKRLEQLKAIRPEWFARSTKKAGIWLV